MKDKNRSLWIMALLLLIGFSFFVRVYRLANNFFQFETRSVFSGFRLHLLDFFNLNAHLTENFFKSFFGDIVGIRYIIFTYLFSGIYDFLGIPYSEFWVFFIYVFLGTLSVFLVFWIGKQLANEKAGWVAACLLAINESLISVSRNDDGTAAVVFLVALFYLLFFQFLKKPRWGISLLTGLVIGLLAGMETLSMLPLIAVYQLIFYWESKPTFAESLKRLFSKLIRFSNFLLWVPAAIMMIINVYVFMRVGISNLGLFGYMKLNYSGRVHLETLGSVTWTVLKTYGGYYFHPILFILTFLLFIWLVVKNGYRFPNFALKFTFIGFVYHFLLFIYISSAHPRHLYIADVVNILFIASVWITFIETLKGEIFSLSRKKIGYATLCVFFAVLIYFNLKTTLSRRILVHPFKTVGYYVREYGGKDATVFNMWGCPGMDLHQYCEYYYGKQLMNPIYSNSPRKIFCVGSKDSFKDILVSYRLSDFTFYVNVKYYYHLYPNGKKILSKVEGSDVEWLLRELEQRGAKKVAVVRHGDEVLAEIYSRENVPYLDLEIDDYNRRWDKKFANIANLVDHKWVGLISTWGERFSVGTGY
jgi:hypothetical protein